MCGGFNLKICILSMVNIKHMSLISLYTTFLEKKGIDYDIIYVDKYWQKESTKAENVYRHKLKINKNWNILKKLFKYYGFRKYAKTIIKANKYDFIIVWRTETALLFFDILINNKNKYSINIRDYCKEKNILIYNLVRLLVKRAKFTTISSKGFLKFLPPSNYKFLHSYNEDLLRKSTPKINFKDKNQVINICFLGYVRFIDQDIKLIKCFANDKRFNLQYFGEGSGQLKSYIYDNNINNVEILESFKIEDTNRLLAQADIINNLYGNNNIALDTAVSTRYYYSLYMRIPILVYNNTYMEEISPNYLAYSVDDDFHNLPDKLYSWYHSRDFQKVVKICKEEIDEIKKTNTDFDKILKNTFLK